MHLWYVRGDLLVAPADQCLVGLQTGLPQLILPVVTCVVHHNGDHLVQVTAESWAGLASDGGKGLDEGASVGEGEGLGPTGHALVQPVKEVGNDVVEESSATAGGEVTWGKRWRGDEREE